MWGSDGVSIRLRGGLGNQLFIFAAGLSKARELEAKLYVFWEPPAGELARRDCQVDQIFDGTPGVEFHVDSALPRVKVKRRMHLLWNTVYEQSVSHEQVGWWSSVRKGSFLVGYFQTIHYLLGIEDEIAGRLLSARTSICNDRLPNLEENDVVMHVRRGDYARPEVRHVHGLLDDNYFVDCSDQLTAEGVKGERFVLTDEPRSVASLAEKHGWKIVSGNQTSAIDEMLWMADSFNLILSNSSFSWWGAWLAERKGNTKVLAPKNWKHNQPDAASKVIPSSWRALGA